MSTRVRLYIPWTCHCHFTGNIEGSWIRRNIPGRDTINELARISKHVDLHNLVHFHNALTLEHRGVYYTSYQRLIDITKQWNFYASTSQTIVPTVTIYLLL